jgi:hypothetical protein
MSYGLSVAVAKAIAKGEFRQLKSLGVTKRSVNAPLFPGGTLKVRVAHGSPFVRVIEDPTPLVYAILCEQTDTVVYLLRRAHASPAVPVNSVSPAFPGTQFTLPRPSATTTFSTLCCRRGTRRKCSRSAAARTTFFLA